MSRPAWRETALLSIAAVERETRIGKDTLRVWERRYGFPQPRRDAAGERQYPADQVERLRVVKRLLDAGHRPGGVVPLAPAALRRLGRGVAGPAAVGAPADNEPIAQLIDILRGHDPARLRQALAQALLRQGLARFVCDTAIPLLHAIGDAWSGGRLEVFEEHLASDLLDTTLRAALASMPDPPPGCRPRVVLSTLQRETHGLGLVMAGVLFAVEGCRCISLGCQMPARDLADAAAAFDADIVAVGSSAVGSARQVGEALAELRSLLPGPLELWAGTPHATLCRRGVAGVRLLPRVDEIGAHVAQWRARQAPAAPESAP